MKTNSIIPNIGDCVELKTNGLNGCIVDIDSNNKFLVICFNGPHCNWQEYSGWMDLDSVEFTAYASDPEEQVINQNMNINLNKGDV